MSKRPLDTVADEPDGKMARLDATAVPGVVKKTGRAEDEGATVIRSFFFALALECCAVLCYCIRKTII
jgi:hypothetical protein